VDQVLKSDYIDGSTPQEQREKWLHRFKNAKTGAFVLISKVSCVLWLLCEVG